MDYNIEDEKVKRLIEIGSIFESMGVDSVELAESIKEHIQNCPGGKACLEKLVSKNNP
ncbi:hypothetical protein N4T77_01330 [Clostridium sp. CX1]|uniref:Zinc-finger domain-containing protein n=1 Tax=Clostridium tanneri TaxID=3037988 RepID=A0ABU4JVE3_9CLOT|nr:MULTISPECIES: hypothetical protein [unclassified Clostridium]MCT8975232.1 hypothetical protein [Clostridium sp. CX1]MDW8802130.1 hypothetical protein [Clostridium sp. A1-XYC3]